MLTLRILLISLCILSACVECQNAADAMTPSHEHRLKHTLMKTYDNDVMPTFNHTETVDVKLGVAIIRIMEVDEHRDELLTKVWMRYQWKDVRLIWNPTEYGDLDVIRLDNAKVWKPDITLYNGIDEAVQEPSPSMVVISHDGTVLWIPNRILRSHCNFNLADFPYDEHNCSLKFGSWTYDGFKMDLSFYADQKAADLVDFVARNDFQIMSTTGAKIVKRYPCCVEPYPDITFYVYLKRIPGFYVHFFVSPAVVMFLLMPFVFLVRPGSGRSTVLGSALMISSSVLMTQVMDPAFANKTPIIMIYYSTTLILTAICMMLVILLEIVYNNSGHSSPPRPLTALCVSCLGRLLAVRENEFEQCTPIEPDSADAKVDLRAERRAQWKALALAVSRAFFVIFLVLNILITLIAFV